MDNYVVLSLETHLFFARIMKEHALFLEAGFPCVNETWIKRADQFREQFENFLRDVVRISDGRVGRDILRSEELVTEFTIPAERATERLGGVPIDSRISVQEQNLRAGCSCNDNRDLTRVISRLNMRALELLDGLIAFKENILEEVGKGNLFTVNYPLLIKHILREARLYRATIEELQSNEKISCRNLRNTERFWNQIMMEHALFIRGLLDPSEEELIETADKFAMEYKELLERARRQDDRAMNLTKETLEETMRYRDFKAAGAEGILETEIASIILPLLADHVLREANHYIRLLEADIEE
ncbi:MAG: DUF2935 domain-containing protein [Lachnospiraceae bacterium]